MNREPPMNNSTTLATSSENAIANQYSVEKMILTIRGVQVILDRDIASLYGVETRRINEQVKRNIERFPEDFMFQLSTQEFNEWKSQNATSNSITMGARKRPYAFTETGVAMLSSVLKSHKAIEVNIVIMRAFVAMRQLWVKNPSIFNRLEALEHHQLMMHKRQDLADKRINEVFDRLEANNAIPIGGILLDGQIFDAYLLISNLVRKAQSQVTLIDNYVDDKVLEILDKRSDGVSATIYTDPRKSHIKLDLARHNSQYPTIELYSCTNIHDRFLIIDQTVYFIGGSIKDLGKKLVAFSKLHINPTDIIDRIKI